MDNTRGLLVDQLYSYIYSDEEKEKLITLVKEYNFNELCFYTGGPAPNAVLPAAGKELAALIASARGAGVKTITIAVGDESEMDHIITFSTGYGVKIDGLWLEYEFWKDNPRDFDRAVAIINYMRAKAPPGTNIGAYIGWPENSEMLSLAKMTDRIFLHTYVDNASKLFGHAKNRLNMLKGAPLVNGAKIKILPIISAEWSPTDICNQGRSNPNYSNSTCFMGPWLKKYGLNAAEAAFAAENLLDNTPPQDKSWRNSASIVGYYYFAYTHLSAELSESKSSYCTDPDCWTLEMFLNNFLYYFQIFNGVAIKNSFLCQEVGVDFFESSPIFLSVDPVIRRAAMRKFKLMTIRNERQFRACTGLSQEEFDLLLPRIYQVFAIGPTATL